MLRHFNLKKSTLFLLALFCFPLFFGSCTLGGITNPDNYSRNHVVYAVDFKPTDLSHFKISKMNEGKWVDVKKVANNEDERYSINITSDHLTVISKNKMDLPLYQTWLDYARKNLGYKAESEYDIFNTIEEGYIYEVDLGEYPLIDKEEHRILMYEFK
ncbi:hypothetical protein SAMN05444483_101752 [Salegentibacter echinorum]|uniref:Uncharacterized protein n=1 Tax=Salegentibacter echinorum TaxID=1073325 RepID=A0A1M5D0R6_SALEC|nr:hypothetical protein [Salegentibacter echinorum]SHF60596.1 hypothetical protein SAMN05444483_101752 [Salegentibacter echinorum]